MCTYFQLFEKLYLGFWHDFVFHRHSFPLNYLRPQWLLITGAASPEGLSPVLCSLLLLISAGLCLSISIRLKPKLSQSKNKKNLDKHYNSIIKMLTVFSKMITACKITMNIVIKRTLPLAPGLTSQGYCFCKLEQSTSSVAGSLLVIFSFRQTERCQ